MSVSSEDKKSIADPDGPLPELPPFPYDNDSSKAWSKPSPKQLAIKHLKANYEAYEAQTNRIHGLELIKKSGARCDEYTSLIEKARETLVELNGDILSTSAEIHNISTLEKAFKPHLEVPPDYPEGYTRQGNPILPKPHDVKSFMQASGTRPSDLKNIWNKLLVYAKATRLCHDAFRSSLISCTTGEVFQFICDNVDLKLPELASALAERFLTETSFSKAIADLKSFTRKANENIYSCTARLQSSLSQASIIYPEKERPVATDLIFRIMLRELVSKDTKTIMEKKEQKALRSGIRLSQPELISIVQDLERETGPPKTITTTTINLNTMEDVTPTMDTSVHDDKIEELSAKLDNLAHLVMTIHKKSEESQREVKHEKSSRRRSLSPATYYRLKSHILEDMLDDERDRQSTRSQGTLRDDPPTLSMLPPPSTWTPPAYYHVP